jgi:hypothetical protein
LSLRHTFTVQIVGNKLVVERPGKARRSEILPASSIADLSKAIEQSRFRGLDERLGVTGICDDCARCEVEVGGPGGHRTAIVVGDGTEAPGPRDAIARFLAVWHQIKHTAGLDGVPDACR